jgi:pyruvate/2-oxoglutarate/acetoin dehydrogenase E1 component
MITISKIINNQLEEILRNNKKSFLIGEGVNDPKGIFGTTINLNKKFKNRVLESPISENAVTGMCIGAAKMGLKPILVHQRVDFMYYSMDQIINNLAKSYFISDGKFTVPVIIRAIIGRGWGQGPMHSQSFETLFAKIPGLKIFIPVFPNEFYSVFKYAAKSKNPIIIFEHRWLHNLKLRKKLKIKNIEKPCNVMRGDQLTVVASGINILEVLKLKKILKNNNIKIDLYNLTCLQPLNLKPIIMSVKKTKKIIIIDNDYTVFGFGAEILARISEYDVKLDCTPIRMGTPFYPSPMSKNYAKNYYINSENIFKNILKVLKLNHKLFTSVKFNEILDVPDKSFIGPF